MWNFCFHEDTIILESISLILLKLTALADRNILLKRQKYVTKIAALADRNILLKCNRNILLKLTVNILLK